MVKNLSDMNADEIEAAIDAEIFAQMRLSYPQIAAEIERLREENQLLRDALRPFVDQVTLLPTGAAVGLMREYFTAARWLSPEQAAAYIGVSVHSAATA